MRISIEKISAFVCMAVLISLVADIGGAIGLKYAAMALLMAWVLVLIFKIGIRRDLSIELVVLLYFGISACYSIFLGIGVAEIYGQLSFVVFFFLLFVVLNVPREKAEKLFRQAVIAGVVIILATFVSIQLFPATAIAWNALGETYRLGYLGVQPLGDLLVPNVYYRWSMWLIPAFILSVGRYRYTAIVIGIAVLITLSTSVIGFTILGTVLLLVVLRSQYTFNIRRMAYVAVLALAVFVVSDMYYSISELLLENITSKFTASSESTRVKLGHIEGVLRSMQSSISYMLFGMGVGSEFFSPGINDYAVNIEVSHFNFVRQFGLVGAAVFFGYVTYVIYTVYQTDVLGKRWSVGLLMLFAAAGTNPLLMSPVFIVVLVMARAYTRRFNTE